MKRLLAAAATCAGLMMLGTAWADEGAIRIKDGPEKELVTSSCSICHSLDYLGMNSPFLDQKGWEATVTKMVKVMGAPIKDDDLGKIVSYLAKNYGKS